MNKNMKSLRECNFSLTSLLELQSVFMYIYIIYLLLLFNSHKTNKQKKDEADCQFSRNEFKSSILAGQRASFTGNGSFSPAVMVEGNASILTQ